MSSKAHVFVARGDLTQLACDAWLVPGGRGPGSTWRAALPPKDQWLPMPEGFGEAGAGGGGEGGGAANPGDGRMRAQLLAETQPPDPLPFLTNIVGTNREGPAWYVEGARHFVQLAARSLRERKRDPLFGRAKFLLGLPLLGTGGGGGAQKSGEVMRALLPAMRDEANAEDVDIALVLYDGPSWAAAQNERNRTDDNEASFATLSKEHRAVADALANKARTGDVVLFLGAGVSQGAGLPSWTTMLDDLAHIKAGVDSDSERKALEQLGELDRAAVIKRRLKGAPLGEAVASLMRERARRHSLSHALLASLPVEEAVTTNYDDLFERASLGVDRPVTVLPGAGDVARGKRWLLKMHGTVEKPETIVLTREDYLKFQENRTALAGIVQALLLTRHMLFVGFSFTDDNFHRIAHAVRNSILLAPHETRTKFGTTLVVASNPLAEELWGEDLDWIKFEGTRAEQARMLEIFLDRMAARAATATTHLGDRRYEGVLSNAERTMRDRIERFVAETGSDEKATGAWAEVERLLRRLGIPER